MSFLATILDGDADFADAMFLVATILAFLAAVISLPQILANAKPYAAVLLALALTAVSLAFLAL